MTDWPVQETLLHAWVEIARSPSVVAAFDRLRRCRMAAGVDSPEEVALEEVALGSAFLKKYSVKLRLWLLETCPFSYGARRQRLWQTFLAKFYGMSRMGIMHLSKLGVLTPLTTLDRHWKSLLLAYRASVRFLTHLRVHSLQPSLLSHSNKSPAILCQYGCYSNGTCTNITNPGIASDSVDCPPVFHQLAAV